MAIALHFIRWRSLFLYSFSPDFETALPLPPFIIALLLSAFCSWGSWKLMKWRIESRRKRSLKTTSQKTALKKEGNST